MIRRSSVRSRGFLVPYYSALDAGLLTALPTGNLDFSFAADEAYTDLSMTTKCAVNGSDTCQALKDLSGNGHHLVQATAGKRPVWYSSAINARPAIRFDGINDRLATGSFARAKPLTFYMVVKVVAPVAAGYGMIDNDANADYTEIQLQYPGGNVNINQYGGASLGGTADTIFPMATYVIITSIFDSSIGYLQVNRQTAVTGSSGSRAGDGISLGSSGGDQFFTNVEVAELVGFSVAHNSTQIAASQDYFASRYGITI